MKSANIVINGHFRAQRVTGVQRYANEVIGQFDRQNISYEWVQPPPRLHSNALRQLWMQGGMAFGVPDDSILWSPTNIGPVFCQNQVLTLHDIADQLHPEWFDAKYVAWRRFILPHLLRRVPRIITVSHFSRNTIVDHYPQTEGKFDVIYNGVQHDHFYPRNEDEISQMREDLHLFKPFVLSVGSLDKRKNIQGLIIAWRRLPDQIKQEMDLVITGVSAQKFTFKRIGMNDKSIRFTGYIADDHLPTLYSAARIFVYPSLFEGFGLPVLEAMACGTPVVTSNTTALKELASDQALTVNPSDPESIAEGISTLLNSDELRSRYIEEGQNYARKFGWDKTARQTTEVLKKCYGAL